MSHKQLIIRALIGAGVLAIPAPAMATGWVYTESNNPSPGQNSVFAMQYGSGGGLNPAHIREFRTKGTGAQLVLGKSAGSFAGDQQVTLSSDRKLLFAVNQGSNTIAVFRVNRRTGALTHVKGSPFPSAGKAPISVGVVGRRVVVANHGVKPPFEPGPNADFGNPNFASFSLSKAGKLKKISSAPAGPGPTQAAMSPSGRNVFSTNFYGFAGPENKTIQSLTVSSSGKLAEGAGSPTGFPPSMYQNEPPPPSFFPPGIEKLAFGIGVHPTKPYVYILGTLNNRVATYKYDSTGKLTFTSQVDNPGSLAACWVVLSRDGKYLYSSNSASQNISTFKVSSSGANLTFVGSTKVPSTGTDENLAIDPTGRYLYAVAAHDDPDGPRPQGVHPDGSITSAPADGNFMEAYQIKSNGTLKSISTTALPVRFSQLPYGLAVVGRTK